MIIIIYNKSFEGTNGATRASARQPMLGACVGERSEVTIKEAGRHGGGTVLL